MDQKQLEAQGVGENGRKLASVGEARHGAAYHGIQHGQRSSLGILRLCSVVFGCFVARFELRGACDVSVEDLRVLALSHRFRARGLQFEQNGAQKKESVSDPWLYWLLRIPTMNCHNPGTPVLTVGSCSFLLVLGSG